MRLFGGVIMACAVIVLMLTLWRFGHDNGAAYVLGAAVFFFALLQCRKQFSAQHVAQSAQPISIERIAAHHWRSGYADGQVVEGYLRHVWHGWGWTTIRLQPYSRTARIVDVTVWRQSMSAAAWHALQVWTTWELAMMPSPESTGTPS